MACDSEETRTLASTSQAVFSSPSLRLVIRVGPYYRVGLGLTVAESDVRVRPVSRGGTNASFTTSFTTQDLSGGAAGSDDHECRPAGAAGSGLLNRDSSDGPTVEELQCVNSENRQECQAGSSSAEA